MGEYKNIEKIHTLDNGTMSVFMKNGKEAIVEVIRMNEKFQAAIYSMFMPEIDGTGKKNNFLAQLEKHDAYKECAKEALGWIDDNPLKFVKTEEDNPFK